MSVIYIQRIYSDPIKRDDSNQLIPFNVRLYMYIYFL